MSFRKLGSGAHGDKKQLRPIKGGVVLLCFYHIMIFTLCQDDELGID